MKVGSVSAEISNQEDNTNHFETYDHETEDPVETMHGWMEDAGDCGGGQAENSADGGVPVPQGQNLGRHGRVASVETVASWEGDHEFLPGLAAPRGGARQETSPAVAPAQRPLQQGTTYTEDQLAALCERYAANEREALQQRLSESGRELTASKDQAKELQQKLQIASEKLGAQEIEIEQMSRELAALRLRVPAGTQQAAQQHPRAPTQNVAGLPPRPPPVAPRQLNLGAEPFLPVRPALPAPPPPQQQQQQAMVLARRPAAGPPAAQRALPEAIGTPQRLLPGSQGHPDDVFDPSVAQRMPWRNAEFERGSIPTLLGAALGKIEHLVANQRYVQLTNSYQPGARSLVGSCNKHLENSRMAYMMLNNPQKYPKLIAGVLNSILIDKIFTSTALLGFPHDQDGHMAAFVTRYQAEKEITYPNPVINDFNRRMTIAQNRADAAKAVQRLPGFWMWVQDKSRLILEEVYPMINATVTTGAQAYREELNQAINELLRLHVRMIQDSSMYGLEFVGTGYAWVSERMVNRDGQVRTDQLSDRNCQWVTQCTISPLVTEEKFERTAGGDRVFISKDTLLKAAVTLCPRKGNLK